MLHLSQWQYWWWFWFAFVWVLYYMLILRTVRRRRLKFKPKLATSMRPHGKWGDLIACLIPLSWCINILINSNFLLKLIEWQNESSLFTLRVRGKQWYWVYKLDFKNFTNIITAPKNVGHNKWVLYGHNSIKQSSDYLGAVRLRKQSRWIQQYWSELCDKEELLAMPINTAFYEKITIFSKNRYEGQQFLDAGSYLHLNSTKLSNPDFTILPKLKVGGVYLNTNCDINVLTRVSGEAFSDVTQKTTNLNLGLLDLQSVDLSRYYNTEIFQVIKGSTFEDNSRFYKRSQGVPAVLAITPVYMSDTTLDLMKKGTSPLFNRRLNVGTNDIAQKPTPDNNLMVIKQKRYKRRKNIGDTTYNLGEKASDYFGKSVKDKKIYGKVLLSRKNQINETNLSLSKRYHLFRKNKKRSDDTSINLSRRMIRTKRTLVLPAHVNITAITNSYDVIHSWFIPGLGLKMDCIPGRSTHHTFYIDNVGFYYGQCAEVCGRYHHHMPIRICALPFDHFLLWWHHFGIPKALPSTTNRFSDTKYGLRKYVW